MEGNAHRNPNLTFKSVSTRLLEQGEKYLIRNMRYREVREADDIRQEKEHQPQTSKTVEQRKRGQ